MPRHVNGLTITEVNISRRMEDFGGKQVLAWASLVVNRCLKIADVRVVRIPDRRAEVAEGEPRPWRYHVQLPEAECRPGESEEKGCRWRPVVHPVDGRLRRLIDETVLEAYRVACAADSPPVVKAPKDHPMRSKACPSSND